MFPSTHPPATTYLPPSSHFLFPSSRPLYPTITASQTLYSVTRVLKDAVKDDNGVISPIYLCMKFASPIVRPQYLFEGEMYLKHVCFSDWREVRRVGGYKVGEIGRGGRSWRRSVYTMWLLRDGIDGGFESMGYYRKVGELRRYVESS